ncbi:MAG: hypothetical protein A2Y21_00775 [Clostridiales bacterium GWC2_40_7]|nr:MAG: hypothetical protein A2Y21_00775 [Clostridiales bacterium GWC2_40_7]
MPDIKQKIDIGKYDKNMVVDKESKNELEWFSPKEKPFHIAGFPWLGKDGIYRRLPVRPEYTLTEGVDKLANHTAGGQIRFRTDSRKVSIKVKLLDYANMPHMCAVGQCGFDCYIGMPGEQVFCGSTVYDHKQICYEHTFYEQDRPEMRNVTLNFPLYQGVEEVLVGLDKGAELLLPSPYRIKNKIVFYGTSITQGGCVSRPGMAYTNIIGRRLNMECVNLGFSGSGKGEPEMAEIIAGISDLACIVLDYEANSAVYDLLEPTLPGFIKIIRKRKPDVPVLVISKFPYAIEAIKGINHHNRSRSRLFQFQLVEKLQAEGDSNIYFFDGQQLFENYPDECTVDGVHLNDYGAICIANSLTPVLRKILH